MAPWLKSLRSNYRNKDKDKKKKKKNYKSLRKQAED